MLILKRANIPSWPCAGLSIFATPCKALHHLCDHVLTRPEADYWAQLIPSYSTWIDAGNDDSLFRFARSLWSESPPLEAAQSLYDGYARIVEETVHEALALGWYWEESGTEGPTWRGLSLSGVYVIWQRHAVRTAMLLGYAAPPRPGDELHGPRATDPLPRQNSWIYRGASIHHTQERFPPLSQDLPRQLYHLFKKGAVRIRREYRAACHDRKVPRGGGRLGSLYDGVPDVEAWQRLCAGFPQRTPQPGSCSDG
jgi:hypothetical protein